MLYLAKAIHKIRFDQTKKTRDRHKGSPRAMISVCLCTAKLPKNYAHRMGEISQVLICV